MKSEKNVKKILWIIVLLNILFGVSYYGLVFDGNRMHEEAHLAIAKNHGCVDYEIDYNYVDLSASFVCLEYDGTGDVKQEAMLHSMNEIVSYNLSTLQSFFAVVVVLFVNLFLFSKTIEYMIYAEK